MPLACGRGPDWSGGAAQWSVEFGEVEHRSRDAALLNDPWFFVPVDAVSGLRSVSYQRELDETGTAEMLKRTRLGYHRAVAALASVGNDVIMDYPLSEPWRLGDLLEVLDGFEVLLVDVMRARGTG